MTYIVPEAHDQDHGGSKGIAHLGVSALGSKVVVVAECHLLSSAELLGEGVARVAGNGRLGVGHHHAVLDVEALDGGEAAAGTFDELRDDGDGLGGVDGEVGAGAVEGLVALAVRVEVATIGIAVTSVAGIGVGSATGIAVARVLSEVFAGVGGECCGNVVGLPDIHLRAACAEAADA